MDYTPIDEAKKTEWVKWLKNQQEVLNGKPEEKSNNAIFETPDGDVANAKDLVGNLLATLTNETVTIN